MDVIIELLGDTDAELVRTNQFCLGQEQRFPGGAAHFGLSGRLNECYQADVRVKHTRWEERGEIEARGWCVGYCTEELVHLGKRREQSPQVPQEES